MPIVAGLGNTGETYAGTRHNVGFEVVRELARRWQLAWTDVDVALVAQGKFARQVVVLAQPQFLMNRSGEALVEVNPTRAPDELVIVHDEIDLPRGCVRVKVGGGTAGHRGVASVAAQYGPGFARVRLGVGRPAAGVEVVDYVLERFSVEEEPVIGAAIKSAAEAVECLLAQGRQAAMLRFNTEHSESTTHGTGDSQRGEGA